jgi:hypothetical protein
VTGKRRKKGKAKQRDDERRKRKKERKTQEAIAHTRAEIDSLLARGVRPLSMRARLAFLKLRYRWRKLSLVRSGERFTIEGKINPDLEITPNIVFDEVAATAHPITIREKDVLAQSNIDRVAKHPHDSLKYESAVRSMGVAPNVRSMGVLQQQAGPLLSPITGEGTVTNLDKNEKGKKLDLGDKVGPENRHLSPTNQPNAILYLGQREVTDQDVYTRQPDTLIQQNEGGEVLRMIAVEATLDAKLKQGHKQTQMAETIMAIHNVYSNSNNVRRPLEIHYVIVAPKECSVKKKIEQQLKSIEDKVGQSKVFVKWIEVPIG